MPWTLPILALFESANRHSTMHDYSGLYNALLNSLFPLAEYYQVTPSFKESAATDSATIYIVYKSQKGNVFFILINPPFHIDTIRTRSEAYQDMHDQYESILGPNLTVPKLYGISMMGTRFAVFEYNKETTTFSPPSIVPDPAFETDIAPASLWSYELLEDEGEQKMRELVEEVKRICAENADCMSLAIVFDDLSSAYIASISPM